MVEVVAPHVHLDRRDVERRREGDDHVHAEPRRERPRHEVPPHVRKVEHRPHRERVGGGLLVGDEAQLAQVAEGEAEGEHDGVEREWDREQQRRQHEEVVVPLQHQQDAHADEDARHAVVEGLRLEERRPLRGGVEAEEGVGLHARHERDARLEAVQPDEREVPADDRQRQVLDEARQLEPAGEHERDAQQRGGERG